MKFLTCYSKTIDFTMARTTTCKTLVPMVSLFCSNGINVLVSKLLQKDEFIVYTRLNLSVNKIMFETQEIKFLTLGRMSPILIKH